MEINIAAGDTCRAILALFPPHSVVVVIVRHRKAPSGADPSFGVEFVCWSRDWMLPLRWVMSFLVRGELFICCGEMSVQL